MEDDEEVLEFRASAGDLLRGGSEREVGIRYCDAKCSVPVPHILTRCSLRMQLRDFDVKQSLQLTNNVGATLHFRLGTLPPFSVLKHGHPVQTSSSSNPSTGDEQYLALQPKHNMQVRCGN